MSRTKRFVFNSLSTAFYQVAVMLAGFIGPRIMLTYYGSEINGLVSSINQFIVYFNLVEAGLSGAAIYALYKPLADQDHKAVSEVVTAARRFYLQAGYIFLLLTIGLAGFYAFYVKTNVLFPSSVGLLVMVLGTNSVLEFFTLAKYRVLLSADQRTYVIALSSLVHIFVNTGIIVVLGSRQVHIVILRLVASLSLLIRSFILMTYVKQRYKYVNYNETPNFGALHKRWDALYLQILGAVHKGAPIVILTLVTRNLKLVSVYTIFNMVIAGINGILSVFTSGLSASFGHVIAKAEISKLQRAYREFEFAYYGLITIVYSVAFITIMPFVRVYTNGVTDVTYDIPSIGFLFVMNGLLYNVKTPQGMLVFSAGLFRETKLPTTIQGAIAIIVGVILAPRYGIVGVLIGSILANIYRDFDLLYYIPRRLTGLPVGKTAARILRMGLAVIVVWIPFFYIKIWPTTYTTWALTSMGVLVYATIVVVVLNSMCEKNMMKSVFWRLVGVVKR